MLKMTERAKAALEEQCENSNKHKKDNQNTEAVLKKVHSDPQTCSTRNSPMPLSPASSGNKSQQPTVEDVDDEIDEVKRGQSIATAQSPELKSNDDVLSAFIL